MRCEEAGGIYWCAVGWAFAPAMLGVILAVFFNGEVSRFALFGIPFGAVTGAFLAGAIAFRRSLSKSARPATAIGLSFAALAGGLLVNTAIVVGAFAIFGFPTRIC